MKAQRTVKEAGGQLLARKPAYPKAIEKEKSKFTFDKFDFSDNVYEHYRKPFSRKPIETIEIDQEPFSSRKSSRTPIRQSSFMQMHQLDMDLQAERIVELDVYS